MKLRFICEALLLGLCLFAGEAVEADTALPFEVNGQNAAQMRDWEVKQLFREGRTLQRRDLPERASLMYAKAYGLDGCRVEILPYWGLAEYRLGNFETALRLFDKYLQAEPDEPLAGVNRALCLLRLGRFEESLSELERWEKDFPNDGRFLLIRGCARLKMNNFEEAEADFKKAAAGRPEDRFLACLWLAEAALRQGHTAEAKELLLSCGDGGKFKSVLANNLAVAEERLGQDGEAAQHFGEAASLGSERGEFNEALLKVFSLRGTDILALAELSDKYSGNPWGDFLYAVALQRSGRYEEAEKLLRALQVKLNEVGEGAVLRAESGLAGEDIELLRRYAELYLGLNYLSRGEPQRAADFWEKLCGGEPDSIIGHYNYALALYRNGEYVQALAEAEAARRLVHLRLGDAEPESLFSERLRWEPVYYLLARLQERGGLKEAALASYREWLRFFPDDPKRDAVERRIKSLTHRSV